MPPVNFYRAVQSREPPAIAQAVALTFMGARAEKWPTERLAGMAAFFSPDRLQGHRRMEGGDRLLRPRPSQGRRGSPPSFPTARRPASLPDQDPREVFADWLIGAARIPGSRATSSTASGTGCWAAASSRSRTTSGPTIRPPIPSCWPIWSRSWSPSHYDLKHIYRLILNSQTYQLSSIPRSRPARGRGQFRLLSAAPPGCRGARSTPSARSPAPPKTYSSAIPEPFTFIPEDQRSISLPDGSITSAFLELFGRPPRDTGLESERNNRPTAAQRLHLLNSSHIQRKIEQSPEIADADAQVHGQAARPRHRLYLTILSRYPTDEELKTVSAYSQTGSAEGRRGRDRPGLGLDQQRGVSLPALMQRAKYETTQSLRHVTHRSPRSRCGAACSAPPACSLAAALPRLLAPAAAPKAKAKSVIQIWMWGGPAHLDTFDPKPEAGNDYCGPLDKPIATNVSGIRICELLPLLAKQADKYSHHPQHDPRHQRPRDGVLHGADRAACRAGAMVYPCVGAVVSLFKGYNAGYKRPDPALHRAHPAAGALLRGRLPGRALQALRHRRRPGAGALRRGRRGGARASPTSASRTGAS